jgi:two-component system, OmpR family, sensor kinase
MEPSQAAKAFDRFYRAESSRTHGTGGSGLGLAIVASIIAAHQGNVALDTQPGNGATFTVWLPRLDSTETEEAAASR